MSRNCRTVFLLCCFLSASQTFAADFGADRHVKKGVACANCHGPSQEIAYPGIDQCTKCHATEALVKKTAKTLPKNPHISPHYGKTLDCTLCHVQHAQTEDYCAQCHKFNFKVP